MVSWGSGELSEENDLGPFATQVSKAAFGLGRWFGLDNFGSRILNLPWEGLHD
jgi:hypothetical protein